jgi:hypothetical protein
LEDVAAMRDGFVELFTLNQLVDILNVAAKRDLSHVQASFSQYDSSGPVVQDGGRGAVGYGQLIDEDDHPPILCRLTRGHQLVHGIGEKASQ